MDSKRLLCCYAPHANNDFLCTQLQRTLQYYPAPIDVHTECLQFVDTISGSSLTGLEVSENLAAESIRDEINKSVCAI
jgi:hypothetical protein